MRAESRESKAYLFSVINLAPEGADYEMDRAGHGD